MKSYVNIRATCEEIETPHRKNTGESVMNVVGVIKSNFLEKLSKDCA